MRVKERFEMQQPDVDQPPEDGPATAEATERRTWIGLGLVAVVAVIVLASM